MLGMLGEAEIEEVLQRGTVGRVGVWDGSRCHVVPISYVYQDGSVLAHSIDGEKLRLMRDRPHDVCFEVDESDDVVNWRSVIAWGDFEEVEGLAALGVMQLLVGRLERSALGSARTPQTTPRMTHGSGGAMPDLPVHAADVPGRAPVAFRIHLSSRTGRFERR